MPVTMMVTERKTLSFAEAVRGALIQALESDERVFAFGEGINDPGGFFGSTEGIMLRCGADRCFDVPNSEEALAGIAVGASLLGQRPVFVNLRIEFLMLAMNQIANHAAKWPAMSGRQCSVPITIRAIIGQGWGQGAQHSSATYPLFAHHPGLQVVLPSGPAEAAGLLLASILSEEPALFIETKPLYGVQEVVDRPIRPLPLGQARLARRGSDITFVAVSHMVGFAERVAERVALAGIQAEVLDLRTVSPLDEIAILESVRRTGRVAVFDIAWPRYALAGEVARLICSEPGRLLKCRMISIGQPDRHVPAGAFLEALHYPGEVEAVAEVIDALRAE